MNKDGLVEYKRFYENDRFYIEVWLQNQYEGALGRNLDTVIDVGALAGEFSFWALENGAKKVFALEPHGEHYKELVNNIALLEATEVKPFMLALSDTNGTSLLFDAGRGGNYLIDYPKDDGVFEVPVKTLATFMHENKINHVDVLKMDIENGEYRVIMSEDFKTIVDKIDCIIGEHLADVTDLLLSYGFKTKDPINANRVFAKDLK